MDESIHIFIVDDNRLLREGLVSMLAEQNDIEVVGAAASGESSPGRSVILGAIHVCYSLLFGV